MAVSYLELFLSPVMCVRANYRGLIDTIFVRFKFEHE